MGDRRARVRTQRVELRIAGEETELDKTVLEKIGDLVRAPRAMP